MKKKAALIVLDGFGLGTDYPGNAISQAKKPNFDSLWKNYPHGILETSGEAVGLPEGQMGNSEVGHQNLGAGRILYQSLTKINIAIKDKSFYENDKFLKAIAYAKNNKKKMHIMGLCSEGGVHSHVDHIIALIELCQKEKVEVYFHAFLDGRDVAPKSALIYLEQVIKKTNVKIASVSGRYYAMDRDKNWDLVQEAYDNMTLGNQASFNSAVEGVNASYEAGVLDEFVKPFVSDKNGLIESGDAIIFANFRPDRAIQIGTAFSNPENAPVKTVVKDIHFVSMMKYADSVKGSIAYGLVDLANTFGEYISNKGLKQLRIAETQKYAHVTFFFDGGVDVELPGSTRVLIDSPKVATFDLMPEMSIYPVTERAITEIESGNYDVVVLNFANCDMVGHTGVIPAAIKATEIVDECLGKVFNALDKAGFVTIITADHGNAEKMLDENNMPFTAHTTNDVPLIITDKSLKLRPSGLLADIAPTMLEILGLDIPNEMTGKSLIEKK